MNATRPSTKLYQMTSLNFCVTGTVQYQLSPKLPLTAELSHVKKPCTSPLSMPYCALSSTSHSAALFEPGFCAISRATVSM